MRLRTILTATTLPLLIAACAVAPEPVTPEQRASRVTEDWQAIRGDGQTFDAPISLNEAMARAVRYNLEQRQKLMDAAVAEGFANVGKYDLLPRLVTNAGWSTRSNENATVSEGVATGVTGTDPSTSDERSHLVANLAATWNVLDFGVSYLRARQDANRILIAEERRRKAVQAIVQDTQVAWLRAVIAEKLAAELDPLIARVKVALDSARTIEERRLQSPIQALDAQKQLLDVLRQLQALRREVANARIDLAKLMNIPPGQPFRLELPGSFGPLPTMEIDLPRLEEQALNDRPELREEDYQSRISADETWKAMLRLLPGIELTAGRNYDSNKYLYNNYWSDAGLRVTWNLMNLLSGSSSIDLAERQQDAGRLRRLALHMAVVTQVHVASNRYRLAREDFEVAERVSDVDERLYRHALAASQSSIQSELELIRRDANRLTSRVRRDMAYVEIEAAIAAIRVSLGDDPVSSDTKADDLPSLVATLEKWRSRWEGRQNTPELEVPATVDWQIEEEPPTEVGASPIAADPIPQPKPMAVSANLVAAIREPVAQGRLQVGSYASAESAWSDWKRLSRRHPVLSAFEPMVREAAITDTGTVYRLQVSGEWDALKTACADLKEAKASCLLFKGQ